jgi:hypothetical protein
MTGFRVARGEYSYETASRLFRLERARAVLSREPELEPWQVAERFGVPEKDAQSLCFSARARLRNQSDANAVKEDERFGRLVVLATGVKPLEQERREGKGWSDGAWCLVRCDCGDEKLVRARHLRRGHVRSCAKVGCVKMRQFPCEFCGRPICKRWMQRHIDARHSFQQSAVSQRMVG